VVPQRDPQRGEDPDGRYTSPATRASPAAVASGSGRLVFRSRAPASAPVSIASTAAALRIEPFPEPPNSGASAARPVSVIVSTVVVRSGTAILRTVALRTPIASASSAINASPETAFASMLTDAARTTAP